MIRTSTFIRETIDIAVLSQLEPKNNDDGLVDLRNPLNCINNFTKKET